MDPGRVVCCSADEAQLSQEERQGLVCEFEGGARSDAQLQEGVVVCQLPTGQKADVEQQGLRMRVVTRAGRQLAEGALPASPADGGSPLAPPSAVAPSRRPTLKQRYSALRPFVIISTSYLLFTITDGAVRMIVLLHAYQKGFSAMLVAVMFSFYELAGVATNLAAGMMGARWGIKTTLLMGLTVQLAGLGMLFAWQDDWDKLQAVIYVTAAQALCGVAKDLTKLGGKTVTKLVTPDEKQTSLFKLVSFITGFKNSLKGAGYFLGAATVGVSYYMSLGILCGLILAAMPWAALGLSKDLGRARKENVNFSALLQNKHDVNVLSFSRIFLFGSRDLWFEVPLPFFLRDAASGIGWSRALTGAFLAIFIIVYGQVQSWTPQLVLRPLRQTPDKWVAAWWCAALVVPCAILGGIMLGTDVFGPTASQGGAIAALTVLLYAFCIMFAVNSAVHSYLIVKYSEGDKVAMNVGVYYCANAVGRLVGTLSSGALYSYVGSTVVDGFGACLFVSVAFAAISSAADAFLHDGSGGRWYGPLVSCCTQRKAKPQLETSSSAVKGGAAAEVPAEGKAAEVELVGGAQPAGDEANTDKLGDS